ncbi:MAG TPA: lytic transglycosylase domain-containing protein [Vicinamibacterales bacterium]|nr:lytic transglycosylase domain-containing protein [Vicinamibacterales bacterium]
MRQVGHRRLLFGLLMSAVVLAPVGPINAEVIFFANGRTMSVKGYRISGDTVTVTLRQGGEATFDRSLVSHIAPSEIPDLPPVAPLATEAVATPARAAFEARPFAELIETVAFEHGIDPALVHAVVEAESNYRATAKSRVGARGLMQVMPATGRDLGVASAAMLFDPHANLEAGVKYLKSLLQRFDGDLTNALAAYNAGPGAVSRYRGVPPYQETRNYVRKVLASFQP